MKVEDLMTRTVRTIEQDTPLREVAKLLAETGISGLPVVDGNVVVGVVSEADILMKERGRLPEETGFFARFTHHPELEAKLEATTAGEAMTSPAVTIRPTQSAAEAASVMIDGHVNRLPVVTETGELVGIVTRADLVKAFVRNDDEIAREIREGVVFRTLWIAPEQIGVSVERGVVKLTGELETRTDAELLPGLVRRIPGVVSVESALTWRSEDSAEREPRRWDVWQSAGTS